MNVRANLVVFCVNQKDGKSYVLSTNENDLKFPYVDVDNDNKSRIDTIAKGIIKSSCGDVENIHLNYDIIAYHYDGLSSEEDCMDMIFGFFIPYKPSTTKGFYWKEYNLNYSDEHRALLYYVVQRIK